MWKTQNSYVCPLCVISTNCQSLDRAQPTLYAGTLAAVSGTRTCIHVSSHTAIPCLLPVYMGTQYVVFVKFYLVIHSLLVGPAVRSYRDVLFLSMK